MKIESAIQKTIKYAAKFGMELDSKQLWLRLMGPRVFSKQEFNGGVDGMTLVKKKVIAPEVERKLLTAKKMAEMVAKNDRNILMMAVTGSVAAENCRNDDDIDILTITRENRLWWSRLKLLFFLIKNKYKFRRYGKKERKNEFCFNMWLEEKSLKIPVEKQGERSAVDLILLKILVDRNNIYYRFLKENSWAKKWVATGYREKSKSLKVLKSQSLKVEKNKKNIIGDLVNLIAFAGQFVYMFPKITKETIRLKVAFFHVT